MEDDDADPTKTPIFKIAAWVVLALVAIGLVITLVMS